MATYGDMQSRIADELIASDLTTQIQRAIQTAIKRYERRKLYFNQGIYTWTLTGAQEFYGAAAQANIPNLITIMYMGGLFGGSWTTINIGDAAQMDSAQTGYITSFPTYAAYISEQLRFFPIPDQAYSVKYAIHYRLTALSVDADTNAWMDDGEELIRQETKFIMATDVLYDDGIAQRARARADAAWDDLEAETKRRRSNEILRTEVSQLTGWRMFNMQSGLPLY